ncbi:hypothetical protein THAOC_01661 [Thalassiosira oceanica]|uniref:Ubiquitin-like domain-containing protein n=1 Tax=Thalassiosira oceanica TaxID=159749 RepID=K0TQS8_THAOC|nr:hypothetical protein THAOC_01661 [Thalassiosira oceanica]|eukprot:EJK76572.1 hypothetical protein THAOC_01661 [Thalassiosira oceanica]
MYSSPEIGPVILRLFHGHCAFCLIMVVWCPLRLPITGSLQYRTTYWVVPMSPRVTNRVSMISSTNTNRVTGPLPRRRASRGGSGKRQSLTAKAATAARSYSTQEDGLFLHGLEEKYCGFRRSIFNGDDLEASSTKVLSFPLPLEAGTVRLSLTRPEQKFDGKVDIYVKTLTGKVVPLRVRLDDTVDDVKRKFFNKEGGIPCDQLRMVAKCRKRGSALGLEDHHSLSDYGVQRDDTVWMILRLRAGMYHPSSGRDGTSRIEDAGRDGTSRIGDECSLGTVKIKYGPGEDELLSIELDEDETCKSLVGKVKERLAAIEELSRELSSVEKRAGDDPEGDAGRAGKKPKV